ncbi:MAG: hypothetical protein HQK61_08105, partial [Desulfamplus sp.]|nr:hypothetical protein [Desulfamplus sp.]
MTNHDNQTILRNIPGVDCLLEKIRHDSDFKDIPLSVIKSSIRNVLERIRKNILDGKSAGLYRESAGLYTGSVRLDGDSADNPVMHEKIMHEKIIHDILVHAQKTIAPRLVPTINATGVVLHTNLGRALLCQDALDRITRIAGGFSNLEFDIKRGKRGERYSAVQELLCELTGAQSAMVVNNNAAAVFVCLNTMAADREVVVSRGELVEIGGSFRIPDVMEKSGCRLKEVGTTNRTHLKD